MQACNARDDDDDDVTSPDAPGEDQLGIVFNEDDDSDQESEDDDGWFEHMIEQNLAGYASPPPPHVTRPKTSSWMTPASMTLW